MRLFKSVLLSAFASISILSCSDVPKHPDTMNEGTIDISADETYKPVIEEELKVFDSSNPNAHINIHYKSEAECIKDYFDGKARIILVTRDMSQAEKDICAQRKVWPSSRNIARDGVAVILNKSSVDTFISMEALKGILTGVYAKTKYNVVFDNAGSSTLRFINDSILKGGKLGANVFAEKGNDSVVDYVTKNQNALGLVGLGYVSDNNDPDGTGAFIKTVRVAAVQNDSTGEFLQPYQAYIALRSYPLTRALYYWNTESYRGLGTGFADFMSNQRGQLIFFHAHMFPVLSEMVIRPAEINNSNK